MSSEVVSMVSCRNCHRQMGQISQDELVHLVKENENGPICFDCETLGASFLPELFVDWRPTDRLVFVDMSVSLEKWETVAFPLVQPRMHASAGAPGLSSSTYLNGTKHNTTVWAYLVEDVVCPECHGGSFYAGAFGGSCCSYCDGFGSVPVLAEWVRFLVCGALEND